MGTSANTDRRTGKRSVIGSVLGSLLLAALVAVALDLAAMAFGAPNSANQALARGSDGLVALENHSQRGGTMFGYQIQY
jgi:hypothetical protein